MKLQRNKYTCFAWAGGTFFPVVLLFQFFVLAGNRFWFYILLCGGKVLLRPEKKDTVICLAGARSLFLRPEKKRDSRLSVGCAVLAITTGKKRYSHLSGGLCCCIVFCSGWKFWLRPGKKRYSRLSGGCAIIITTGKKRYNRQHSICVSSTWIKTNTIPLDQLQHMRYI